MLRATLCVFVFFMCFDAIHASLTTGNKPFLDLASQVPLSPANQLKLQVKKLHEQRMNTLDSVLPHLLSSRFQTLDSADDKSISPVPIASEIRYALNNVMKTTEETNDVVVLKSMLEAYKTGMDALQAEVASLQQQVNDLRKEVETIEHDGGFGNEEDEWTHCYTPECLYWKSGWNDNECRLATVLYTNPVWQRQSVTRGQRDKAPNTGMKAVTPTIPDFIMVESVQTPLALGDKNPNNVPPYHANATTNTDQVAGQNFAWWFTYGDGSSSIGTSGTWGGLVKMAVYNSTYFPNCDVLAGTSLQTGTPGVIGTYNAANCPIFITSDVTGTAVGTKFTQGACSFYVRSMPFAPNPSQDNNWVERFSFQCDGLMRRYKGPGYLYTKYPNGYYKYVFCPRVNSKPWVFPPEDAVTPFIFPPWTPPPTPTGPVRPPAIYSARGPTCSRRDHDYPVGTKLCVDCDWLECKENGHWLFGEGRCGACDVATHFPG